MPDFGGALAARFKVLDQRHVGAGAADIERQDVADPGIAPHPQRAGHPARGARHQDVNRVLLGLERAHQPAVRTQQRQLARHAGIGQFRAQVGHVLAHHRAHRGIGDGGQRALVFLHFGQHFVAERDRHARQHFSGDLAHPCLVCAAGISVDQADGDRLDALLLEEAKLRAHIAVIERAQFLALGIDPALDRDRVFKRGERGRFGPDDPCRQTAGHIAARDLHHVAIALGGHQPHARTLAFEHGIGGNGGAVEEIVDRAWRHARFIADRIHAGQDAFG